MHHQDTILTLTCETCSKTFERPRAHMRRSRHAYCSPQCCGLAKRIMPERRGVYAIVHRPSGRTYIGSTRDLPIRWASHRLTLRKRMHQNPPLQAAWDADGAAAFSFVVLEEVASDGMLIAREQAWLDQYRAAGTPLFNVEPHAGTARGRQHAATTRAKWSAQRQFSGKLSPADVVAIKTAVADGTELAAVAAQFGVTRHTIYCVVTGRMWPDVVAPSPVEVALAGRLRSITRHQPLPPGETPSHTGSATGTDTPGQEAATFR